MTMPTDPNAGLVYRSTDGGASWQFVRALEPLESFVNNGAPDTYPMLGAVRGDPWHVAMLGHANYNVQQIVWMSDDGGQTWAQVLNAADPVDGAGDWMVYGPGGILALAARSIIVAQARGNNQVSIMG